MRVFALTIAAMRFTEVPIVRLVRSEQQRQPIQPVFSKFFQAEASSHSFGNVNDMDSARTIAMVTLSTVISSSTPTPRSANPAASVSNCFKHALTFCY